MRLRQARAIQRTGFTLVELMVVILIIAVLVTLLSATVALALGKSKQVSNRNDVSQIEIALNNFKTRFGFYPPSRIKLCEVFSGPLGYYTSVADKQLDDDSIGYLGRMFPRINWAFLIDWNGNGAAMPDPPVVLEGEQCLVFFLGGIPSGTTPPTCLGFSTNPQRPALNPIVSPDRLGPFYTFDSARLGIQPGTAASFYSYLDTYKGQPYAYFSSYKAANGYNRYSSTDCPSLKTPTGVSIQPYYEAGGPPPTTPAKYLNPDSFQIISAGGDGMWGAGGGPWTPAGAGAAYPAGTSGRDDQSNFYDSLLGVSN